MKGFHHSGRVANLLREASYVHNSTVCWGPPRVWEIETTSYCSGRCIMCPKTYDLKRTPSHMPLDVFRLVIDQLTPASQSNGGSTDGSIHLFHYGSPTLYPGFADAIRFSKQRGLRVIISEIAALFDTDRAEEAIDAGLDDLWLCLDGMDDETCMRIRGPVASFTKGRENILALVELKRKRGTGHPDVQVIMIRQPANVGQWEAFIDYWGRVEGVSAMAAYCSNFGGNVPALNRILSDLRALNGQPDEDRRVGRLNRYRCFYPWHSVCVLSDGRIVPCCRDMNGVYILGDIREKRLRDIWNDEPIRALRKEHISGNVSNPLCRSCNEANNEIGPPSRSYPGFRFFNALAPGRFARRNGLHQE